MQEIIHYDDKIRGNLYIRSLYGLTIFEGNDVPDVEDAMITFLRAVVTAYPCSAQIGLLPLERDDPREVFAPLREGEDYVLTHINSYAHGDLWVEPNNPAGCFFPHLTESFFDLRTDDGGLLIDYLLLYDQPFLYVNVDELAVANIKTLYAHPPLSEALTVAQQSTTNQDRASSDQRLTFEHRWWEEITGIIPIGLWGGYDDAQFTVYSRDPAQFKVLNLPLTQTCLSIRSTSWFQAHQDELRWPEEHEGLGEWSLMLPSRIEEEIENEKISKARRCENLR
jgi:hypothetical protein